MKKAFTLTETLVALSVISTASVAVISILNHFEEKYGKADYELIEKFEEDNNITLPDYYHKEMVDELEEMTEGVG